MSIMYNVPEVLQAGVELLVEEGDVILHVSILPVLLDQHIQHWH